MDFLEIEAMFVDFQVSTGNEKKKSRDYESKSTSFLVPGHNSHGQKPHLEANRDFMIFITNIFGTTIDMSTFGTIVERQDYRL